MIYASEGWRPDALEVIALVGDLPTGWRIRSVDTLASGPAEVKAKVVVAPTEGEPLLVLHLIAHPSATAALASWRAPYAGSTGHPKFLDAVAALALEQMTAAKRENERLSIRHECFARMFEQITTVRK